MGGEVICAPPCIFYTRFSIENILGHVEMTLPPTTRNGGHWWAKIPADGAAAYPAVAVMTMPRVVTLTKTHALRYEPFAGVASMRRGPAFELSEQLRPGDVLDITQQLLQSKVRKTSSWPRSWANFSFL